jgi:hypothetical protein
MMMTFDEVSGIVEIRLEMILAKEVECVASAGFQTFPVGVGEALGQVFQVCPTPTCSS